MATGWNSSLLHSDRARWACIYPAYINSVKTLSEGRRLPKEKCVENPNCREIGDVLAEAGMKVVVENKLYSRERSKEWTFQGRVRVQLKNDDGTPINAQIQNKDSLLAFVGAGIPKYRLTRPNRGNQEQHHHQQQSSTQGGAKNKGKKGRR